MFFACIFLWWLLSNFFCAGAWLNSPGTELFAEDKMLVQPPHSEKHSRIRTVRSAKGSRKERLLRKPSSPFLDKGPEAPHAIESRPDPELILDVIHRSKDPKNLKSNVIHVGYQERYRYEEIERRKSGKTETTGTGKEAEGAKKAEEAFDEATLDEEVPEEDILGGISEDDLDGDAWKESYDSDEDGDPLPHIDLQNVPNPKYSFRFQTPRPSRSSLKGTGLESTSHAKNQYSNSKQKNNLKAAFNALSLDIGEALRKDERHIQETQFSDHDSTDEPDENEHESNEFESESDSDSDSEYDSDEYDFGDGSLQLI